ncbi:unnamed protein product [Lactuca saligna]|uniref:ATP-dependent DNA helicase n=1 Tax=Lactuca saligna TaxID=75948 RepID=A0AA36DZM7_LACSI|nr:unnamed protein product [Lactuca saligna]
MLAELLKQTSIIIWDEAPMSDRRCFECLDRSLKDILDCEAKTFGGMSMLLGGDFRQTLPVSPKSTPSEIVSLTLPNSYLWPYFKLCKLSANMRLKDSSMSSKIELNASDFATWLVQVGDGRIGNMDTVDRINTKWIEIPRSLLIPPSENGLDSLINFVYGDIFQTNVSTSMLSGRAIVCPKNETIQHINDIVMRKIPGVSKIYESADSIEFNGKQTTEFNTFYPLEYLNGLTFPSIPAHSLLLKINTPIMLIRNINQKEGLCNGTRLMVSQLLSNVIEASIITGTSIGKKVFLPRIRFIHKAPDIPFTFIRKQFPVKICYGMTINKSQVLTMSQTVTTVSNLHYGCPGTTIQLRILRMWTPQVRTQETWFLAVDRNGDAVQILGQRKDQGYLQSVLIPSKCYTIEKYACGIPDRYQKWLDNEVYIAAGMASSITSIQDTHTIPACWFTFITKKQIADYVDRHADFIGVFSKLIRCTKKNKEPYLLLILKNELGEDIAISLWKECTNIPSKFDVVGLENTVAPVVVAITSIKISTYDGSLRLGTSSASHLYINPPIPETPLLTDSFRTFSDSSIFFDIPTPLGDILQRGHPELLNKSFTTKAVITAYVFSDCWYQVQCPNCKMSAFKQGKSWFCPSDGIINAPTIMFKLSATLTDENNSIVALLSDNAAQDLFGSTADKLIPDDDINCRGQLPAIATTVQGIAKKMKLRITNTSTDTNIRFMITDIEKSNPQETTYPTTPAPHHQSPSKDSEKDCSSVPQHSRANVRRSLPFESQDTSNTKRKSARKIE